MKTIRRHTISFVNAFNGIIWAIKTQPNFRVHLTFALIALVLGAVLRVTYIEMILLIMVIVFCLSVEMVNTSIEAMTDLIEEKWHYKAKIAKDVSAGMMLLAALGAVLTGGFIFLPRIF